MDDAITRWAASHGLVVDRDATLDPSTDPLAVFDTDGTYRYALIRRWSPSGSIAVIVMLNPSTATARATDRTLQRCVAFARREGHSGLLLLNLFALRSTDPAALESHDAPVGPANDSALTTLTRLGDTVIVAWGTKYSDIHGRAATVTQLLYDRGVRPWCLGTNQDGSPRHPLYLDIGTPLTEYTLAAVPAVDARPEGRTSPAPTNEVWWYGQWECHTCGASGDSNWLDGSTPESDHDCEDGQSSEVAWGGEWECHPCGATGGEDVWDDGVSVDADHECPADSDDSETDAQTKASA